MLVDSVKHARVHSPSFASGVSELQPPVSRLRADARQQRYSHNLELLLHSNSNSNNNSSTLAFPESVRLAPATTELPASLTHTAVHTRLHAPPPPPGPVRSGPPVL